MNIVLIIRPEIANIFILLFLIMYNHYCHKMHGDKLNSFAPFAIFAFVHNLFALITEITVNNPSLPAVVNDFCHILFFLASLAFSSAYLMYILRLVYPSRKIKKSLYLNAACFVIISIITILFDIKYLQGDGTKYSAGIGPSICFTAGILMFLFSDAILIINRKNVERHVLLTLIPLSCTALVLLIIQILVPEFLITGSALTIVSIGVFFAIENPIGNFEHRAMIDLSTGLKNKNCYYRDCEKIKSKFPQGTYAAIVCDLNNLKRTNDEHGHLEGDTMISIAANTIMNVMPNAYGIYRFGGDEFIALYANVDYNTFRKEQFALTKRGERVVDKRLHEPLSFAVGGAYGEENESLEDVVSRADRSMYAVKGNMKSK